MCSNSKNDRNDPSSDVSIPPSRLCRKLDADMDVELKTQAPEATGPRQKRDAQIDRILDRTIQSFAARWLPLVLQGYHITEDQVEEFIKTSWRTVRKDMLKVKNVISYWSVLTLYLFAQTPIPIWIPEDEELDGISGLVCMQTALLQIQKLREPQRNYRLNKSELSAPAGPSVNSSANTSLSPAHLDFESRAWWAAVMWDTSLFNLRFKDISNFWIKWRLFWACMALSKDIPRRLISLQNGGMAHAWFWNIRWHCFSDHRGSGSL